jgi:hypothetical protein
LALPKLAVPQGGSIAFVHFADVVVALSLSRCEYHYHTGYSDSPAGTYEEVVALRDHSQNAFLAIGFDGSKNGSKPAASLTAMTIQSGLLNIDVTLEGLPLSAAS